MRSFLLRRWRRRLRQKIPWIARNGIALCVSMLHMSIFLGPLGKRLEPLAADMWFRLRGQLTAPEEVIIVAIDEVSYKEYGVSRLEAWPREYQAALMHKLAGLGVRQVVLDFMFEVPGKDPEIDRRFAESLKLLPTTIGSYYRVEQETDLSGKRGISQQFYAPLALFAESAGHVMVINMPLDNKHVRNFFFDGRSPRTPMADTLRLAPDAPAPGLRDMINYYGPAGSIRSIPVAKLLKGEDSELKQYFENKVVLVGVQVKASAGLPQKDSFAVPASEAPMFGVEIHATVAANLLRQEWLRRFPLKLEVVVINIAAFFFTLGILKLKPTPGGVTLLAIVLGWCALSYTAFLNHYFVPGLVLVLIVLPTIFMLSSFFYYLVIQHSHRKIEQALGVKLHVEN